MNLILRDAGLSKLMAEEPPEALANGFEFTEGPLWSPDDSVLFQDIRAERTYRLLPDRSVQLVREKTNAANGQTFGADGRIFFCEQNGRRVSAMKPDGTEVETITETWSGKRLNSPNDIVSRSDGYLYFTDPAYGVSPKERELHFQGVYLLDSLGQTHLVADDFEKPNGLAFSPDERTLYVCDTARNHVRAFDLEPSGSLRVGSSRVFATMDPEQPGGPDGMKVDRDGRVYVAVAQGIWVYDAGGQLLGIIAMPKRPSNLAWCGREAKTLTITMVEHVYQVRLNVAGILPPFTPQVMSA
jgi:gluconolactonase